MGDNSKKTLLEKILEYDIIVVEGYDGVGKTTFIRGLLPQINGIMYRPDYYYWESLNFPKKYRSFIGASILDFLSSVPKNPGDPPIIFDRGVLSGMVYTNPIVGKNYQYLISKSGRKLLVLICGFLILRLWEHEQRLFQFPMIRHYTSYRRPC